MYENRCLYCNAIIPEGRQLCPKCEEERAVELIKTKNEFLRKIHFSLDELKLL